MPLQPASPPAPAAAPAKSVRGPGAGPELDVFSSLTEIKRGTIPLLVRMPNNHCEQIEVPYNSTVDDIAAELGKGMPGTSADDLRLSFGNTDLRPGASLLDTNIVDAYEHAGSLLNIIDAGELDVEAKAAALDSTCAVVESISNGVKDMETLCAAAMEPANGLPPDAVPTSPRTAGIVAAGAAEAERDTPKELDGGEFKMLNNILSRPPKDEPEPDAAPAASPSQLARSLSRRLPLLFPAPAATPNLSEDGEQQPDQPAPEVEPNDCGTPAVGQPSISSIRDARRRIRQAQAVASPKATPDPQESAANAVTIGGSTNGMPAPANHPVQAGSQRGGSLRDSAAVMAAKTKSTWLEDVMKTWEVKYIRQSGVLEKSKEGQEISEYFNELDAEAQREVETAQIEAEQANKQANPVVGAHGAGDSEDEEEDEGESQHEGHTVQDRPVVNANNPAHVPDKRPVPQPENGTDDLRKSMAGIGLSDSTQGSKDAASQMMQAQTAATAAILTSSASPASPEQTQTGQSTATLSTNSAYTSRPSTPASSGDQQSDTRHLADTSRPPIGKTQIKVRQATKIAPAPNVGAALSPGVPGVPNGMFPNTVYPGGIAPGPVWRAPPPAPVPKKRGRKRKNPELTEEERALVRKEQNRESAKLSRVRRKVIAAEYEGRLNTLIGENTMLRKQVEGLNNRLVYLQSLLTISVRQEPGNEARA